MDPEQIYQEVLQEEQAKGVSAPVAEGRAKAARQRAVEGSPHPKEAKWWPGAQPQFEGGEAAEAEEAEEVVEEPVEEPAPAPAAEAPAAEPAAEAPTPEGPTPEGPTPEGPTPEAPAQPAAEPAPAAEAQQPATVAVAAPPEPTAPARVERVGVSPGQPAGNRLRPEDAVASQAQFDGQKAMEQRRKLIDDLVATGVPSVTAAQTGERSAGWITALFLLIPLLAIAFLVGNQDNLGGGEAANGAENGAEAPGGNTIVSVDFEFEPSTVTVPAGEEAQYALVNEDTAPHNIKIFDGDDASADMIFDGDDVAGGGSTTYTFPGLESGEYFFYCSIHPAMEGTVVAE